MPVQTHSYVHFLNAGAPAISVDTVAIQAGYASSAGETRDPLQQPFASSSIWNMPIGSGAVYHAVHADGSGMPDYTGQSWVPCPNIDDEPIILSPASPLRNIMTLDTSGGNQPWGGNRCLATSTVLISNVPIPAGYTVPSDGQNECASFLLADGRTIVAAQPLAICSAGANPVCWVSFPSQDLYGDGILGSHGGSYMSGIGGSLRVGELRPGQQGPRHALKLVVDPAVVFYNGATMAQCYRWPAATADSFATAGNGYGSANPSPYAGMTMGALLAIPASVDLATIGLSSMTGPGAQLAWTLQNYGAYVVDSTSGGGSAPAYDLCVERGSGAITSGGGPPYPAGGKREEFYNDWGMNLCAWTTNDTSWVRDFQKCMSALKIVDNNGPSAVGGGGTPLQPLAPPISP